MLVETPYPLVFPEVLEGLLLPSLLLSLASQLLLLLFPAFLIPLSLLLIPVWLESPGAF